MNPFDLAKFAPYVPKFREAIERTIYSQNPEYLEKMYADLGKLNMDLPYFKFNEITKTVEYDPEHPFFDTPEAEKLVTPGKHPYRGSKVLEGMINPRYRTRRDFWNAIAGKTWEEYVNDIGKIRYNPHATVRDRAKLNDIQWLGSSIEGIPSLLKFTDMGTAGYNNTPASEVFSNAMMTDKNYLHLVQTALAKSVLKNIERKFKSDPYQFFGGPVVVPFLRDQEYMSEYIKEMANTPEFADLLKRWNPEENVIPLEWNRSVGGSGAGAKYDEPHSMDAFSGEYGSTSEYKGYETHIKDLKNKGIITDAEKRQNMANLKFKSRDLFPSVDLPEYLRSMGRQTNVDSLLSNEAIPASKPWSASYAGLKDHGIYIDSNFTGGYPLSIKENGAEVTPGTYLNHVLPWRGGSNLGMTPAQTEKIISPNFIRSLALNSLGAHHLLQQDPRAKALFSKADKIYLDTGFSSSIAGAVADMLRQYLGLSDFVNRFNWLKKAEREVIKKGNFSFEGPLQDSIQLGTLQEDFALKNGLEGLPPEFIAYVNKFLNRRFAEALGEGAPHRMGSATVLKEPKTVEELLRPFKVYDHSYDKSSFYSSREGIEETLEDIAKKRGNTKAKNPIDNAAVSQVIGREPLGPVQTFLANFVPEDLADLRKNAPNAWEGPGRALGPIMEELKGIGKDWESAASSHLRDVANEKLYMGMGAGLPMAMPSDPSGFAKGLGKFYKEVVTPSERYGGAKGSALMRSLAAPLMGGIGEAGEAYKKSGDVTDALIGLGKGTLGGAAMGAIMSKLPGIGGLYMGARNGDEYAKALGLDMDPTAAKALGAAGMLGAEIAAPEFFVPATMAMGAYDAVKPWYEIATKGVDKPSGPPKSPGVRVPGLDKYLSSLTT
jgi:hypothetical protein